MHEFDSGLSPEAEQFLDSATIEFNAKQNALDRAWNFHFLRRWDFDQISGLFRLTLKDDSEVHADGQVLATYCDREGAWEWAWNHRHLDERLTEDARRVKALGEQLGIEILQMPIVPVLDEELISHLAAISTKAVYAQGAFRGEAGRVELMLLLRNLRRVAKPEPTLDDYLPSTLRKTGSKISACRTNPRSLG